MARVQGIAATDDPSVVLAAFAEHRAIHAYGIIDVLQFWDTSRWWVRGGAVVGLVGLPRVAGAVVYAVSAVHGGETLDLLAELAPQLPDRFEITGPVGLTERLAATHRAERRVPSVKMHLLRPDLLPAPAGDVPVLQPDDMSAVRRFAARSGMALTFFREDLLGTGCQVAVREGDEIVALAGVHLVDAGAGIAVVGDVVTLPERRGAGLATQVVAALCRRLHADVDIVALNVARDNAHARTLYERLGFMPLMEYEEAALVRR